MAHSEKSLAYCRALLLEDDDLDSRAVLRALRKSQTTFDCDRARLVGEVGDLVQKNQYDIILTDMDLPDSNGLDTINTLLRMVGSTPIVILSGNEDDSIALEAVHSGAQDFIPKQYINDTGLINRTLRHAMERHQLKLGLEKTRDRERFLAQYDQCTALPNRLLFLDRISQTVKQAQRNQTKFAIFFVDLDRFKHINDALGHGAGDEVLRCVGERMKALVRESDTVARFGGDEFAIILQLTNDSDAMQRLAEEIVKSINQPIPFGQHLCSVGASIGISCYPSHGYSPEHLLKNADIAMYEAKNKGRNQVQFFNKELFEKKSRFYSLERALREALRAPDESFELYFQPRVDLASGKVFSVEALIRWHHPKLGNIPPQQFISLAEDLGVIRQIDEWVFEAACRKVVQWREMAIKVSIGINISGSSFNRRDFVSEVIEPLVSRYSIEGSCLEIEITEGVLLADTHQVLECLQGLKHLGISLALDDFGTGFSSLSYLKNFPIDTLKIDGSFICDGASSESEKALLEAIIALGNALRMKVVAECVETEAQLEYLFSLGCQEGQGFFWCKPCPNWLPGKHIIPT